MHINFKKVSSCKQATIIDRDKEIDIGIDKLAQK